MSIKKVHINKTKKTFCIDDTKDFKVIIHKSIPRYPEVGAIYYSPHKLTFKPPFEIIESELEGYHIGNVLLSGVPRNHLILKITEDLLVEGELDYLKALKAIKYHLFPTCKTTKKDFIVQHGLILYVGTIPNKLSDMYTHKYRMGLVSKKCRHGVIRDTHSLGSFKLYPIDILELAINRMRIRKDIALNFREMIDEGGSYALKDKIQSCKFRVYATPQLLRGYYKYYNKNSYKDILITIDFYLFALCIKSLFDDNIIEELPFTPEEAASLIRRSTVEFWVEKSIPSIIKIKEI